MRHRPETAKAQKAAHPNELILRRTDDGMSLAHIERSIDVQVPKQHDNKYKASLPPSNDLTVVKQVGMAYRKKYFFVRLNGYY